MKKFEDYYVDSEESEKDSYIMYLLGVVLENYGDYSEAGDIVCRYAAGTITFEKAVKMMEKL